MVILKDHHDNPLEEDTLYSIVISGGVIREEQESCGPLLYQEGKFVDSDGKHHEYTQPEISFAYRCDTFKEMEELEKKMSFLRAHRSIRERPISHP